MQFDAGSECVKRGDFVAARTYFEEALIEDPDHEPTVKLLAKLELLAPTADMSDDEEDDEGNEEEADLVLADAMIPAASTKPAPSQPGTKSTTGEEGATEGVKVEMRWSDQPSFTASEIPAGSPVAVSVDPASQSQLAWLF